ncbi:MAG: metalloregulator ArsR/SmtB family transcription factor [Planctomycetota bacterium]
MDERSEAPAAGSPPRRRAESCCGRVGVDLREGLGKYLCLELFRALGDPTRLQVLGRLALSAGPQTVTDVAGCCGVHLSGVSRHLACLRKAGVVDAVRRGREVRYSLKRAELSAALRRLADVLDACAGFGNGRGDPGGSGCPPAAENDDL